MHGCLNGIGQWFVAGIGGIRRGVTPGFQTFELQPASGVGGLASAAASFQSPYGLISSSWKVGPDGGTQWNVTVHPTQKLSCTCQGKPLWSATSRLVGQMPLWKAQGSLLDPETTRFTGRVVPMDALQIMVRDCLSSNGVLGIGAFD